MTQLPPAAGDYAMPTPTSLDKTSGLAVASLILGLLGFFTGCIGVGIILGLIGLVLGIVAVTQIGKPGKPARGTGMAVTGIVLGGLSLLVAPLMIGIMLPALGAARQTARQMQSMTQARGIHQASIIHAQGNEHRLADDIGVLAVGGFVSADYFLSPMASTSTPHDFDQWPDDQKAQWARQNASFILVPGLTDDVDYNKIAVFGRPDHFAGRGIPVTTNDNASTWETDVAAIDRRLKSQTGMSMQQLIDRQTNLTGPVP